MKIYISGPISGRPLAQARADFARAAAAVKRRGHEAVNPCKTQDILRPETTSWRHYMLVSLALLDACDAVLLLDGWQESKGARLEYETAIAQEKPIFAGVEMIPENQEARA